MPINTFFCCGVVFAILSLGCSSQYPSANANTGITYLHQQTLLTHLQRLSSDEFSGRKVASAGSSMAQQYIIDTLTALSVVPLTQSYQQHFAIPRAFAGAIQGSNIVGVVRGYEQPERFIVLSAHFDHEGKQGHKIFNGADDNASGTAALLGFAEIIQQQPLRYSVIFLFTDAEELGLKGATAFLENYHGALNDITINLNLDMIAGYRHTRMLRYLDSGLETVIGAAGYAEFARWQEKSAVNMQRGFKQTLAGGQKHINWYSASDHSVFHRANIPFIYYGVGTHVNYHTENDTFENVNQPFFVKAADTIFQQLLFIDHLLPK